MRDSESRGKDRRGPGWDSPQGYIEVDPEEAERFGAFEDSGVDLQDVLDSGMPEEGPRERTGGA